MAREFDITDIAGLRRSPSVAGFRARQGSQNAVPFRPGAAPQRPSILSEMTPPAAPATPARSRNEQAWMAAQLNPNMGVLPPELSTGSRFLDDELLRRARRQAGVANGQAAIQELKRQQWLTGQRTVADEMPGATAPEYAGAWQETQVGPSDNGVWTAPDGTRYAMRNGVPVGRSGAATGGTWEMGAGQVGEFTGGGDTASRQNYLRDELLGKMGQTMEPPARRNVIPMQPPAPTPQVAQTPQAPPSTTPPAPSQAQPTVPKEVMELGIYRTQEALNTQGVDAAIEAARRTGIVPKQKADELIRKTAEIESKALRIQAAYQNTVDSKSARLAELETELLGVSSDRGGAPKRRELVKEINELKEDIAYAQREVQDDEENKLRDINNLKREFVDSIITKK